MGAVIPAVLGGPLVDRLGFKRSSVLADLASAAVVAAVPLLHLAGVLQFWRLVVLVFVLSSVNAQGDTGRYALVPFLADRARMPIERANGADRAIVRLGQVVGPILGGILIVAIGAANVLFVDAASFGVSAVAVATVGNLLDKPLVTVILPVYAKTFYGSPTASGWPWGPSAPAP